MEDARPSVLAHIGLILGLARPCISINLELGGNLSSACSDTSALALKKRLSAARAGHIPEAAPHPTPGDHVHCVEFGDESDAKLQNTYEVYVC